jgi:hypothetical protein
MYWLTVDVLGADHLFIPHDKPIHCVKGSRNDDFRQERSGILKADTGATSPFFDTPS